MTVIMSLFIISAALSGCAAKEEETAAAEPAEKAEAVEEEKKYVEDPEKYLEDVPIVENIPVRMEDFEEGLGGKKIVLITKSEGNPYMDLMAEGFTDVVRHAGGEAVIFQPEEGNAEAQIEAQIKAVEQFTEDGVAAIAIAANDHDALGDVLAKAMEAGIRVSCLDSKVGPDNRMLFCNQAGITEIGEALINAVYDISGGEGQYAILSTTEQAANQSAWIAAMKETAENNEKYAGLELVEVAYGNDDMQTSVDKTRELLDRYPDLKVICAPTTVGIAAAAEELRLKKRSVLLTGLGLPSQMASYIGKDVDKPCPYMFLWDPEELGKLSAYASIALVEGDITGEVGDRLDAGELGLYTLTEAEDGGSEVVLGPPYRFDSSNIDKWKDAF